MSRYQTFSYTVGVLIIVIETRVDDVIAFNVLVSTALTLQQFTPSRARLLIRYQNPISASSAAETAVEVTEGAEVRLVQSAPARRLLFFLKHDTLTMFMSTSGVFFKHPHNLSLFKWTMSKGAARYGEDTLTNQAHSLHIHDLE